MRIAARKTKPYKGMAMEGMIASWYAKNTRNALPAFRALAERIAAEVPRPAAVLEIAPGPGYLAIELAKLGFRVAGLDISRSFVRIAAENAAQAHVPVDFREGDAAAQPFKDASFDFLVCRAAFKNFADPVGALCEMHRVLKPGGRALIVDMRRDARNADIAREVKNMQLPPLSGFATNMTLRALRKRAYSREDFVRMLAKTPFAHGEIAEGGIGLEVRLARVAAN